jgi:hypothetical protein
MIQLSITMLLSKKSILNFLQNVNICRMYVKIHQTEDVMITSFMKFLRV